jgi:thiol-disulfide isomerase/thioredoxin
MRLFLICCAVVALAACQKPSQLTSNEASAPAEPGPVKGADRTHKGTAAPDTSFNDPEGNPTTLAAFAGTPTLVNLWATWCAPCVNVLPSLVALARAVVGKLNIVAVSQDMGPHASVEAFLKHQKIATLDSNQDPKMALSTALGAPVMPTSILFDANGKEVWRYVGDLDWTGPEAAKLLADAGVASGS